MFPVHTRMVPNYRVINGGKPCVPRAYEDGPIITRQRFNIWLCSPCIREWSYGDGPDSTCFRLRWHQVFPVHTGMVP